MRVVGGYLRGFCCLIAACTLAPTACGGRTVEDPDGSWSESGGDSGLGGAPGVGGGPIRSGGWTSGGWTSGGFSTGGFSTGGFSTGGFSTGGFSTGGFSTNGGRASGGGSSGGRVGEGGVAGWDAGGEAGAAGEGPCPTAPLCDCAENFTKEIYVDPIHGRDAGVGARNPTGIQFPPSCRFATLGNALSKAREGFNVIAFSEDATVDAPATFRKETFPLTIPAGVRLRGPVPGERGAFRIAYNGSTRAVELRDGSAIDGFIVVNAGGSGSLLACKGAQASIRSVVLQGDAQIGDTARLDCGVSIHDLEISGGHVCLDATSPNSAVTFANGSVTNCSLGIWIGGIFNGKQITASSNADGILVQGGRAQLTFVTVQGNQPSDGTPGGRGVMVDGGSLLFDTSEILENHGTGLEISGGTLEVLLSTILGNGWGYPKVESTRASGIQIDGAVSVHVSGGSILNSGLHGIHVAPGASVGELALENLNVQANAGSGLEVDGTVESSFRLQSSELSYNEGDGITFQQGVPLGLFSSNRFVANRGAQLRLLAPAVGSDWILGAGSCLESNVISCYDDVRPAIFAADLAYVDAGHVSWQFANPVLGREYVGPVDAHDPCPASTSTVCVAKPAEGR